MLKSGWIDRFYRYTRYMYGYVSPSFLTPLFSAVFLLLNVHGGEKAY